MAEEWRYHIIRKSEIDAGTAVAMGAAFKNQSNDLMHIRRVDGTGGQEQADADGAAIFELRKNDTSTSQQADEGSIPQLSFATAEGHDSGAGSADAGGTVENRSWVFPRGAFTLEPGETLNALFIPVNDGGGNVYSSWGIWYHY